MTIKLKDGTIYFLRERSVGQGGYTPFCKIGLVANERTTEQRVKEHQTGNPREIVEVFSVPTCAVTSLETYLHERYSPQRISGEWFRFEEAECDRAIADARSMALTVAESASDVAVASELKKVESTGDIRKPTDEEASLHREILVLHQHLLLLGEELSIIELQIRCFMGSHPGIAGVADVVFPGATLKFDQARFQEEYPDRYAGFLLEQPDRLVSRFQLKSKPTARSLDDALKEKKKALKAEATGHVFDPSLSPLEPDQIGIDSLQAQYLRLLSERAELQWQADLKEAELQAGCGVASGIEGVCDWKRELKPVGAKFDESAFKEQEPELYERYLESKVASPRLSMKPYRPLAGTV